jgi:hypothetical protein
VEAASFGFPPIPATHHRPKLTQLGYEKRDDMKKRTPSTRRDYLIGYGKPPKANQFRKGRSGNPRGRTPGQENLISVFKRLATKKVKINDNGVIKSISWADAVISQNLRAALNRDQAAMANILRLAEHAGEFKDLTDPKVVGRPLIMPEKMSEEEFEAFYGVNRVQVPSTRTSVQRAD